VADTKSSSSPLRYELIAESAPAGEAFDPIEVARRTLRGRWLQALVVAIALGVACGYGGYSVATPMYESSGLLRVSGARSPILFNSEETKLPPNFDALVSAQATFLKSRQVLTGALETSYLHGTEWPTGNAGVVALEEAMTVSWRRGEQVIAVAVRHEDPALAQAAVNGVLYAFYNGYNDPDHLSIETKQATLQVRADQLEQEFRTIQQAMLDVSDHYGTDAIEQLHESTVRQIMAIDHKLTDLEIARTELMDGAVIGTARANAPIDLLAAGDDVMTDLRIEEQSLLNEIEGWTQKYGPRHPILRQLARRLEAVRSEIAMRENSMSNDALAQADSASAIQRLDRLRDRYLGLQEELQSTATTYAGQLTELRHLAERKTEVQERLAATRQRLDELAVETNRPVNNRVTIASSGDFPIKPVVNRRAGLAGAGALFGLCLGVVLTMTAGATDPRIRFADQLSRHAEDVPVVTVLPDLTGRVNVANAMAETGVHQLRNIIDVQKEDDGAQVIAITRPTRGDGRTTVALGLATSFAAAGRRTLLIDADIAQPTLTRQLRLTNGLGIRDTLGESDAIGEVHQTSTPHLWLLPSGQSSEVLPEDLSRERLHWLIEAVRDRFDVIVLDTGSMTDSVEAPVVTASADRVLMIVSRNQNIRDFRRSMENLRRIDVSRPVLVFNRAPECDLGKFHPATVESATSGRPAIRLVDHPHVTPDTIGRIDGDRTVDSKQAA